ncbi:MAG: nucleoside hydrolase [Victivallales bacterium]|nr:nucleoside hydrolase [Victivallales bacterium]
MTEQKKIPVILQTDIGGDIDDFWALSMLLKQPWLDLKFILTDTDNTVYRAAICAKLLAAVGRTDVEIGAGIVEWPIQHVLTHLDWIEKYELKSYPNYTRYGIERFIEIVKDSPEPVTVVAIGPAPSLAEALRRAPEIAKKINFVGMFGSIYSQHNGKPGKIAEYNIRRDIPAAQTVFSADWLSATITPLDTCGRVILKGDLYRRIEEDTSTLVRNIAEVYHIWRASYKMEDADKPVQSSILFDTVAVHLASSHDFLKMVRMKLTVDNDGLQQESPDGKPFDVAIEWTDLDAYCNFLVDTLTK